MSILRKLKISSNFVLVARNLIITLAFTNKALVSIAASGASNLEKSLYCTKNIDGCRNSKMSDDYTSGESSVVFVTTPDENSAKKIAHGLINQKLAACVNIVPQIQSIYMWEGKINEDNELLLMIKTRSTRVEELTKWVRDNHPYSVAEVITLPIAQGNMPYLKWIRDVVPEKKTE